MTEFLEFRIHHNTYTENIRFSNISVVQLLHGSAFYYEVNFKYNTYQIKYLIFLSLFL